MNVLRMIKLFAWEGKVKQRMYEKREDELLWTKKRQFLQLLNMNAKYVRMPPRFVSILTAVQLHFASIDNDCHLLLLREWTDVRIYCLRLSSIDSHFQTRAHWYAFEYNRARKYLTHNLASRVFSSMAVFDMLRDQLHIVLWGASATIQGKVSLDRLTEFLNEVSNL
jgi:hypothetical protein